MTACERDLESVFSSHEVERIVKLERFKLKNSFQDLLYTQDVIKLESFFQLKACQVHFITW